MISYKFFCSSNGFVGDGLRLIGGVTKLYLGLSKFYFKIYSAAIPILFKISFYEIRGVLAFDSSCLKLKIAIGA